MQQLDQEVGLHPLERNGFPARDFVGFPISQGAEVPGRPEQVEEVGRPGPRHSKDEGRCLDFREGVPLETSIDLVVVPEELLNELFQDTLAEAVEAGSFMDTVKKKLPVLPRDGVQMFSILQLAELDLPGLFQGPDQSVSQGPVGIS